MKVSTFAMAAMCVLAGCVEDPDESSASGPNGSNGGTPGLYTELDSIVFGQLDFLYFHHTRSQMQTRFSPAAMALLSDDTLLFKLDSVYHYDSTPSVETFLRTKFEPKGWLAYHDVHKNVICKPDSSGQSTGWFIRLEEDPEFVRSCTLVSDTSPISYQVYTVHYPGKGFVFYMGSSITGLGLGKARLYYWR